MIFTDMDTEETTLEESAETPLQQEAQPQDETIPTEAAPLPSIAEVQEMERKKPRFDPEKTAHWDRILTGDADTIPDDVRRQAGADDDSQPPEEREYNLLTTVNRSWAADHLDMSREQVRADWKNIRNSMADMLQVGGNEQEVFQALSERRQGERKQEAAQDAYRKAYLNALDGMQEPDNGEDDDLGDVREQARRAAEEERERFKDLLPDVVESLKAIQAAGEGGPSQMRTWCDIPELVRATGALAELEPRERACVYRMAAAQMPPDNRPRSLVASMGQGFMRSGVNMLYNIGQAAGNVAAATGHALGRRTGWDSLDSAADKLDKRLQTLEEMRRTVQDELYPVEPPPESGWAGRLAVDAASAAPQAGLAFCGGTGFAMLAGSGVGESIAEARQRNPQGDHELQTAAGLIGGAIQSSIFIGMGKIGQQALGRSIDRFVRARGGSGYLWAGLQGIRDVTAESAKLLLAGKAGQAADLGMHELAARVQGIASNIDWKAYGENLTDIECNLREAAATLPYVLLASGRAALRHFQSPRQVLGDGLVLREQWGFTDEQMANLASAPSVRVRDEMLHTYLSSSKRWSAPGFFPEIMRAMRLLNTDYYKGFTREDVVRDFLNLPSETAMTRKPAEVIDTTDPAQVTEAMERMEPDLPMQRLHGRMDILRLMDRWWKNAHFDAKAVVPQEGEPLPSDRKEADYLRSLFHYRELLEDADPVPQRMRRSGFYAPTAPEESAALMRDRIAELQDLSYRYLLNNYALDKLTIAFPNMKTAERKTENERRELVAQVCDAIMNCVDGHTQRFTFTNLSDDIFLRYEERAQKKGAPSWMKGMEMMDFYPWNRKDAVRFGTMGYGTPEPRRQMFAINVGLRSCAKTLYQLLPHTDDFQTALSRGCTVPQAYALLLRRELGDSLPEGWRADLLEGAGEHPKPNPQYAEMFNLYRRLTGCGAECATGEDGRTYWRIRRPDGRYTRWHEEEFMAVNDLVSNSLLNFLPTGGDTLQVLEHGVPSTLANLPALVKNDGKSFTGFEQACSVALEELSRRWLESASLYPVGMDVERVRFRLRGNAYEDGITPVQRGRNAADNTTIDRWSMATPLALLEARMGNYWRRMFNSRLITPAEAGDFLVEQRFMQPQERDSILKLVKEDPFEHSYVPKHRKDYSRIYDAMADALTRYSRAYMLGHLNQLPLPQSVRTWVGLIPFCEPESSGAQPKSAQGTPLHAAIGKKGVGLIRWANRKTADKVKEMVDSAQLVGNATLTPSDSPQVNRMLGFVQESIHPSSMQRLEQAWCHRLGGSASFASAGQEFRNLLERPAEAWETILPEIREELARTLARTGPLKGKRESIPAKLLARPDIVQLHNDVLQLDAVLKDHPELREYAINPEHPGQVDRLELHPVQDDVQEPVLHRNKLYHANPPKADYSVERNVGLPEDCAADPRVMPALKLLTDLRCAAANRPYVDQNGIWWQHRLYGGLAGNKPGDMSYRWRPELPFEDAVSFLEACEDGGISPVCSHLLKPLRAPLVQELMMPITIYRHPFQADNIIRLMPGETEAGNPRARTPYVVQSYQGAPVVKGYVDYDPAHADDVYQPLSTFAMVRRRGFGSAQQDKHHDQLLLGLVLGFMERAESVESLMAGRMNELTNREMLMRLGVDTRFCESLAELEPGELTRGQGCAAALVRGLMGMEFSNAPQEYAADLVELAREIDADVSLRHDLIDALQTSSGRATPNRVAHRILRHHRRPRYKRKPVPEDELPTFMDHWDFVEHIHDEMLPLDTPFRNPELTRPESREEELQRRAEQWEKEHRKHNNDNKK